MRIQPYLALLRPDHWFKNVVVLLGTLAAVVHFNIHDSPLNVISHALVVTFLACLISSVNYSINDITDEKGDAQHPIKKNRVVPSQKISKSWIYVMISVLLISSLLTAFFLYGLTEMFALILLFIAGIFYNIKPFRLKDLPVFDVVAESINNPIRIIIGWYAVAPPASFPPISFLLLFWTAGAVLMSAKRYAEYNYFLAHHKKNQLVSYRSSFQTYTKRGIFAMVFFYILATVGLFILFAVEFRRSLLFALPFVIGFFIWFLRVMDEKDSFFRQPEKAFAQKPIFSATALVLFLLLTFLALS